jgi:hypothetical protein
MLSVQAEREDVPAIKLFAIWSRQEEGLNLILWAESEGDRPKIEIVYRHRSFDGVFSYGKTKGEGDHETCELRRMGDTTAHAGGTTGKMVDVLANPSDSGLSREAQYSDCALCMYKALQESVLWLMIVRHGNYTLPLNSSEGQGEENDAIDGSEAD